MAKADPVRLVADFPASAAVRLRLLNAAAGAQDKAGFAASLVWLNAHGHVFSRAGQEQITRLASEFGIEHPGLITRPAERAPSRRFAAIPAQALLVEAVARDPRRGRLFAATVVSRRLWVRGADKRWLALEIPGVDSLSGMVLDRGRDCLWIASGDLGMGKGPPGAFHGLIAIDLASLKETKRIAAPAGVNPGDIALGRDGTLYASDPVGGGVYRARAGDSRLAVLVAPGTFRSPQGLAEGVDADRLYVSDYGYGIAVVDLADGRVSQLGLDAGVGIPLDGIDGLWRQERGLVAVQNGTSPRRIVRLGLDARGLRVVGAQVLEQANPAWSEPLSGTIEGNRLIYVANGQWDRFENGAPLAGKPPLTTWIHALQLRTTKR